MKISAVIFDLNRTIFEDEDEYGRSFDITKNNFEVRLDFVEFVESLRDSGAKIALATSNTWEKTEDVLIKSDIKELFDVVTTTEEAAFTKPAPDLLTLTADKLEVEREDCLVIEDTNFGVVAAHEAGMKVILIEDDDDSREDIEADYSVGSFAEITPKVIEEL